MNSGPGRPGIYRNAGFLDPAICRRVRQAMDRSVSEPAEILAQEMSLDTEVRRAFSVEVDADTLAVIERAIDSQRDGVAAFFGEALVEREGAGFLRYPAGGFYRAHRDCGMVPSWPDAERRKVAVVIFLNGAGDGGAPGFSGGMLRMYLDEGVHDIVPREGTLVAFSASVLHEVTPVVAGVRDSIVDWFY